MAGWRPSRARAGSLSGALLVSALAATPHAQSPTAFERAWQSGTPVSVSGELTVIYGDDFEHRRSELIHVLRDERTGDHFQLRFESGAPENLRSGTRVTVRGRANGQELYLADGASEITVPNPNQLPMVTPVTGDQRTLVIVADFQDVSVTCSIASVTDIMFTDPNGLSVDAVYRDNSNDCVSFSGTVAGPYTIDFSGTGVCDPLMWAEAAEAQAIASGVDVASYPRKVYVLPPNSCPMSGYGSVGGATSAAWVFSCNTRRVFQHELGHNLGMMHASSPGSEYGDNTDPMGIFFISNVFGFNAPHRHEMGWLPDTTIQTVSQDGTYELAPLGLEPTSATAPRALLIRKPDTGEYYYVSYRFPVGYDRYIDGLYFYRSTVHRYRPGPTAYNTYILAGLADSEAFADTPNGITVTQIAHYSTHALVSVELTNQCEVTSPSISVAPPAQGGPAGSSLTYSLSVTNNDSTACPASTFALSSAVPGGWTAAFSPAALTLDPGASGNATLMLASQTGATAATYDVAVNVNDSATAGHAASAGLTYTVVADTTAPTPPGNLTATARQKQKQIQLSWSAATDTGGVAGYAVLRNGLAIGLSSTTSWLDAEWSAGSTYTYSVLAYDAAGNWSAPSNSATVTLSGGGKRR